MKHKFETRTNREYNGRELHKEDITSGSPGYHTNSANSGCIH